MLKQIEENSKPSSLNALKEKESIKEKDKEKSKRTSLYPENLPTFYVGPGNNSDLYDLLLCFRRKNKKKAKKSKQDICFTQNLFGFSRIVESMKRLGWEQVFEKHDDTYQRAKLQWVQTEKKINWNTFREGKMFANISRSKKTLQL
jgi:hypothetical protein